MAKKKIEPVKLTPEEERQYKLDSFFKEDGRFIPDPTYSFQVGDKVDIGNLENVIICNVINDRAYEIEFDSFDRDKEEYGDRRIKRFVAWHSIRPFNNETQNNSLIQNDDVRLSYSQMSLESVFSRVYHFGTNFDPEYQREFVWDLEDKKALIDSIFNNIDIGKFVFIQKGYHEELLYEILDGKQRIRAILDYYENRFPYKGLYYNDLCKRDRNHLRNYPMSVAEVRDCDRKQVPKYFVMLNKHGRIMDKKQIEKVEKMMEECE